MKGVNSLSKKRRTTGQVKGVELLKQEERSNRLSKRNSKSNKKSGAIGQTRGIPGQVKGVEQQVE